MLNLKKEKITEFLINNGIYLVMGGLILFVIITRPDFLSIPVFINILAQSSVKLILALGVGGIIVLQGTDLSLGRIAGFATVIAASLLQRTDAVNKFFPDLFLNSSPVLIRLLVTILICIVVCTIITAINGYISAKFDVHPFVVTLGTSLVIYGLNTAYYNYGGGQPIGSHDEAYKELVNGNILNFKEMGIMQGTFMEKFFIPHLVIYAIIIAIIVYFLWNKTVFGKNMYAVGGNPEAAKVSGINVIKVFVQVNILAGVLYGLGGFLEAARIGSANNATGMNYELDAIAACVIGGISFSGGVGNIKSAVIGVLMFQILAYGMLFLGLGIEVQNIIKGTVIVAAVALDRRKYIKKR